MAENDMVRHGVFLLELQRICPVLAVDDDEVDALVLKPLVVSRQREKQLTGRVDLGSPVGNELDDHGFGPQR